MKWVGITAVVLALGRYPYHVIREQRHFQTRAREGTALVQSYAAQRPAGVSPVSWDDAVGSVQTAWGNVVFSPEHIDEKDLDAILARMRELVAGATPAEAEGDLYLILDLLAHAKTTASVPYLSGRRAAIRDALPGFGRPSPGLVTYARSRVGSKADLPALAAVAGGLRSADWTTRVACCRALGQYGLGLGNAVETRSALDGLIRALGDGDPLVRAIAAECLLEMRMEAARARDALIGRRYHDSDVRVRWQALRALPAIEKNKTSVIATLIAAIDDREPAVGEAALVSLAEIGREAHDALPAIFKALESRTLRIRIAAVSAIAGVGSPPVAVSALIDVLKIDVSWRVRADAIDALANLGPEASAALPALIESLERGDMPAVRSTAALALARIAPDDPRTIASLARALKRQRTGDVRAAAAEALGEIGPPAAPAVPSLVGSLEDPDPSVRTEAETALRKIRARP
jgi:HEAT repeat protein